MNVSLFTTYSRHLNQLSIRLSVTNSDVDGNDGCPPDVCSLEITGNCLVITLMANNNITAAADRKHVRFDWTRQSLAVTSCLKQLQAFDGQTVGGGGGSGDHRTPRYCRHIYMTVDAKMGIIPMKLPINRPLMTPLPIDKELMNDWIFCHNHKHKPNCQETTVPTVVVDDYDVCQRIHSLNTNDEVVSTTTTTTTTTTNEEKLIEETDSLLQQQLLPSPTCLTLFDQIIVILREKISQKYLFESIDKNYSLAMNLVNYEFILSSNNLNINLDDSSSSSNVEQCVNYSNKTSVLYKLFRHKTVDTNCKNHCNNNTIVSDVSVVSVVEPLLHSYRFAFDVQLILIDTQLMVTLISKLIESTKTILPFDMRLQKDIIIVDDKQQEMFFGYLDV
ncbi:uncharacterized protein LOC128956131 [Oppia nitens]|uniref:uncharacterized protein LOC128956131 n=1 Tax=Oppia nitens TaxID=1686743 RepID=UPI0023DB44F6|nr:uncharacterized protein LOC128956131 [Oppia nitens]